MNTNCLDDFAGVTLGVLDAEEQDRAEKHLAQCVHCRKEAAEVADVLHTTLGYMVTPAQPSPLVRTQLLARLAMEMGSQQAHAGPARAATPQAPLVVIQEAQPAHTAPTGRRPIRRTGWIGIAAAVPTLLAVLFGIMALNMKHQIDDVHTHILAEALLNTPHVIMPLGGAATRQGMQAEVILPKQGTSSLLIVAGIPTPAPGMDYRCWVHMHGQWMHSARLQPDASGMAMMVFDHSLDLHQADDLGIAMGPQAQPPTLPSTPMLLSTRL